MKRLQFPYVTGDGIGIDITPATQRIVETARQKEYGSDAFIEWIKLFAGEESYKKYGTGLPQETIDAIAQYGLAMKGPLGTPIGKGERSFNVSIRKLLDLYTCVRPIKYYDGVPSSHIAPRGIDALLFRENTEDLYSQIETKAGSKKAQEIIKTLTAIGFDVDSMSSIGIKNISQKNTERLIKRAAEFVQKYDYDKLTIMHKGNIMKFTEGAFMKRGYDKVKQDFGDSFITQRQSRILQNHDKGLSIQDNAGTLNRGKYEYLSDNEKAQFDQEVHTTIQELNDIVKSRKSKKIVGDMIADNALQQAFLNPHQFGVIASTNLNGDYMSDALAGSIGGLGVAPGANINFEKDIVLVEATHGTAPDLARNLANPLSHTLSASFGLALKGHKNVTRRIEDAIAQQLLSGRVTGDLVRTAQITMDKVQKQAQEHPKTPGIEHLLEYTRQQRNHLTMLNTSSFADEICERIVEK